MVYIFESVFESDHEDKLEELRDKLMKQISDDVVLLHADIRLKEVVKTDKSKAATTERHFCINVATYDIPDFERWDASPTKRMNLYHDGDIIGQLYVIKERYKLASFNDAVLLDFIITKDDIDLNAINDIYTLDYGFTVNEVENEITLLLYTI